MLEEHVLAVADEASLLLELERFVGRCLELGDVFGIVDVPRGNFIQVLVTPEEDLVIETSIGSLAEHSGFSQSVPEFNFLSQGLLPAHWHSREKLAASAFARSLIDGHKLSFPAELTGQIFRASSDPDAEPVPEPTVTPGARTIGFLFENRPRGEIAREFGPALGLDDADDIGHVTAKLQQRIEAELGPLNRAEPSQADSADVVVEVGNPGSPGKPGALRAAIIDGQLVITGLP